MRVPDTVLDSGTVSVFPRLRSDTRIHCPLLELAAFLG